MEKDFIDLSPKELNFFLIENYGLGLFEFSFVLALILKMKDLSREPYIPSIPDIPKTGVLKDLKNRLQNWHKKTIKLMLECDSVIYGGHRKSFYRENKEKIGDNIYIEIGMPIYQDEDDSFLFSMHFYPTISLVETMIYKGKGAPIKKRTLIIKAWGILFSKIKNRIPWNTMADLLDWFRTKLGEYCYYADLSPSDNGEDVNYLKNQYYRNKSKNYLLNNYCKSIETGRRVIFTKDCADITPMVFSSSNEWCIDKYSSFLNKEKYFGQVLEGKLDIANNQELQMADLRYHVYELLKNKPDSLRIIMFPDLSYLIC